MEQIYVLLGIIFAVILGLFVKNYLPTYMNEKGKNLATKEDIKDITLKTEEVKAQFQKDFANFSSDLKFRNEFNYERFKSLYAIIYSVVCKSEYYRYFESKYSGNLVAFEEIPFFETCTLHQSIFNKDSVKNKEKEKTALIKIVDIIFQNPHLCSQKLLKLSMAYQFILDNRDCIPQPSILVREGLRHEELKLTREIIETIIYDYNNLCMYLRFDFLVYEIEQKHFDSSSFQ